MEIACTICSRDKSQAPGLIPAHERYIGGHLAEALRAAKERGLPLYILSGLLGLKHEDEGVPLYDHLLGYDGVDRLAEQVAGQIQSLGIKMIWYYHRPRESWMPYLKALCEAQKLTGVGLILMPLSGEYAKEFCKK